MVLCIHVRVLWYYSQCIYTPGKLNYLPDHGRNRTCAHVLPSKAQLIFHLRHMFMFCLDGCEFVGVYPSAIIFLYPAGSNTLMGKWTTNQRPKFNGEFTGNCSGEMTFPDDRTYRFEYNSATCTVYWDGRNSGKSWQKTTCK